MIEKSTYSLTQVTLALKVMNQCMEGYLGEFRSYGCIDNTFTTILVEITAILASCCSIVHNQISSSKFLSSPFSLNVSVILKRLFSHLVNNFVIFSHS